MKPAKYLCFRQKTKEAVRYERTQLQADAAGAEAAATQARLDAEEKEKECRAYMQVLLEAMSG